MVTLPLYDEPFVVLLPAGHPLASKEQLTADELAKEQLLLLGPGHCFRDQVLESCPPLVEAVTHRANNGSPALVTEGSSLETIRHMVASGLGITVLPLSAATAMQYHEDILAVRPFAPPVPFRTVALAWRVTFPGPRLLMCCPWLPVSAGSLKRRKRIRRLWPKAPEPDYDVTG